MPKIRLVDVLFGGAIALLGVGQEYAATTPTTTQSAVANETKTPPKEADPEIRETRAGGTRSMPVLFAEPHFLK